MPAFLKNCRYNHGFQEPLRRVWHSGIVVALDWDTPDAYLVDEKDRRCSRWLLKNCVFARLPAGDTFYEKDKVPAQKPENRFSLFAQTIKRRRTSGP